MSTKPAPSPSAALESDNPLDVLRAWILELEAQNQLLEDRNFYLEAENSGLKHSPTPSQETSGQPRPVSRRKRHE
jgi:hypothetical protein